MRVSPAVRAILSRAVVFSGCVGVYVKARPTVVNESPVTRKPSAWELGQPRANGNAARGVVSHVAARDGTHLTPATHGAHACATRLRY